jgi:hypothetical protein
MALNGTATKKLKVEFLNTAGVKKVFNLTLAAGQQNYTFDLTGFTSAMAAINFVADELGTTSYTVETKGLAFTPAVTAAPFEESLLTALPGSPVVNLNKGTSASSGLVNAGTTATETYHVNSWYAYNYTLGDVNDFVFSQISWGYFNATNTFVGTAGNVGSSLVLALNGPAGKQMKVEVWDSSHVKKEFFVNLTGTWQNYTLNLSGLDTAHIGLINFVTDQAHMGSSGSVGIVSKGLAYTPVVTGLTYNQALLTSFADSSPSLAAGSGNTVSGQPAAAMRMTQNSANEFEYEYDLSSSATSFAFNAITLGGAPFSLPTSQYVFAARGTEGERVKVEITDTNNHKASFIIVLGSSYQNFALDVPAEVNRTLIKEIVFVQDRNIGSPFLNDYVKVQTSGLAYTPPTPILTFEATRDTLVQTSLNYFDVGVGVDATTHFPYDNLGDGGANTGHYTQPTLIGFYLQILGDVVTGKINNGMTRTQALAEINTVMTNLLSVQSASYSWNGLIPWLNLNPLAASSNTIALGDNANLSQSIAVMVGALESGGLSGADLTAAQLISTKADQYLSNQAAGYAAFVDSNFGIFHAAYDISNGTFSAYIDRVSNEFRGAVAFLAVYYAGVPDSVWNNLVISTNSNYIDRNGQAVENLAPWDGAAFQVFWPGLRNDESSYIGFRNALYNMLATQLDYAYQNRIPGILSTGLTPEGSYAGTGIPQMAEANMVPGATNTIVGDVGSTYALAAAMGIDHNAVLGWLDTINNLFGMMGDYGFYDSARSGSEISNHFIGVDVASMILGLAGNGPSDFTTFLRNRGIEDEYNHLYDTTSRKISIDRTNSGLPNAPQFPDRSLTVFSHIGSEGTINNFQTATTQIYGVHLTYNSLQATDSGHFWKLSQAYDAQANQLILNYSAVDSPQFVRIELKDGAGVLLYQTTVALQQGTKFTRLVIDLPNQTTLASVQEIDLVVDPQEGGDATGDFTIHSINFQHIS